MQGKRKRYSYPEVVVLDLKEVLDILTVSNFEHDKTFDLGDDYADAFWE